MSDVVDCRAATFKAATVGEAVAHFKRGVDGGSIRAHLKK